MTRHICIHFGIEFTYIIQQIGHFGLAFVDQTLLLKKLRVESNATSISSHMYNSINLTEYQDMFNKYIVLLLIL